MLIISAGKIMTRSAAFTYSSGLVLAQGREASEQPRGIPLYPIPTILRSGPTIHAPT
jgi:hypothetical protein